MKNHAKQALIFAAGALFGGATAIYLKAKDNPRDDKGRRAAMGLGLAAIGLIIIATKPKS